MLENLIAQRNNELTVIIAASRVLRVKGHNTYWMFVIFVDCIVISSMI